jgi:hypothetical protein
MSDFDLGNRHAVESAELINQGRAQLWICCHAAGRFQIKQRDASHTRLAQRCQPSRTRALPREVREYRAEGSSRPVPFGNALPVHPLVERLPEQGRPSTAHAPSAAMQA